MRKAFSHYEENIRASRDRIRGVRTRVAEITESQGERAAFAYLVKELHYEV